MVEPKKEGILAKILNAVLGFSLASMVILVFINAVLRYTVKSGIPQAEELSRYFFVWIAFIGAVVAYRDDKHVGVDILVSHLKGKARLIVNLIGYGLIMIAVSVMAWGGYNYSAISVTSLGPSTGIPFLYVAMSILVAAVAIGILCIHKAWNEIKNSNKEGI